MILAPKILMKLGAMQVSNILEVNDPESEEEFRQLKYDSPTVITWQQYKQVYDEIKEKEGLRILKQQRMILLQTTDWVMTADNFQSLANKDDWVAYRQMLRDLPANHPPFIWKQIGELDFKKMGIPSAPPILRTE